MKTQVCIIGSGPVGMTLAVDLCKRGVPCIIVEQRNLEHYENPVQSVEMPKCNRINARTMEHFRRLGIADTVRRHGLPLDHPSDMTYVTSVVDGREITRFVHRSSLQVMLDEKINSVEEDWPTPEPPHMLAQMYLEPILRLELSKSSLCKSLFGWKFISAQEVDDGVCVEIQHMESKEIRVVNCIYCVGCDGGKSAVRKTIEAKLEGTEVVTNFHSTFFRSRTLKEKIDEQKNRKTWMFRVKNQEIESFLITLNGADLWLHHVDLGKDHGFNAPLDELNELWKSLGCVIDDVSVIRSQRWVARAMVSSKYIHSRIVLCGDAAHIWIPLGGFGMNIGVEDACNLAWKLAGVIQGWAGPSLLKSYEEERRPVGKMIAEAVEKMRSCVAREHNIEEFSILSRKDYRNGDSREAKIARQGLGQSLRNRIGWEVESIGMQLGVSYQCSSVLFGARKTHIEEFEYNRYKETCKAGHRLPHQWIDKAAGVSLFDLLGNGFCLITKVSPKEVVSLITTFEVLRVPLKIVELQLPKLCSKFVLVRPDQYIAWCGEMLTDTIAMGVAKVVAGRTSRSSL